jgi:hypothetical protein
VFGALSYLIGHSPVDLEASYRTAFLQSQAREAASSDEIKVRAGRSVRVNAGAVGSDAGRFASGRGGLPCLSACHVAEYGRAEGNSAAEVPILPITRPRIHRSGQSIAGGNAGQLACYSPKRYGVSEKS